MKSILILLLAVPALWAGPSLILTSKEGKSLEAELLSATDKEVRVRLAGNKKIYDISLATLDEASLVAVEKARKTLANTYPKYESEVSIGKRRRPNDSYYMETQDISATVKVTNTHRTLASPKVKSRLVFLGQDQSQPSKFQILATRDFMVSPAPDRTVTVELKPFSTTYDSDNEGEGNIGGYKYDGYILVLYKKDDTVAHFKTTNARYRKAIDLNLGILDRYRTIKEGTVVGEDLLPFAEGGKGRGDVIEIAE